MLFILTRIVQLVTADQTGREVLLQHFGRIEFLSNVVDPVLAAPFQRLVVVREASELCGIRSSVILVKPNVSFNF